MSTIHNPKNFEPTNYAVVDYLDNREPEYVWGMEPGAFKAVREDFFRAWKRYFPAPQYRCAHCGNGRIRYVAVCRYKPTGEYVAFGDICAGRLEFESHDEFKAEMVRRSAAATALRIKTHHQATKFCDERPRLKALVDEVLAGKYADNDFMQDITRKLFQYGSLSERQEAAFLESPEREARFEREREEKAARLEQERETTKHYGEIGSRIEIEATVTDDFSFPKRNPKFYGDLNGHCVKLVTDEGERLIYWNYMNVDVTRPDGTTTWHKVQKGDRLRFRATVKKHGTDRDGRKETTLARVLKPALVREGVKS